MILTSARESTNSGGFFDVAASREQLKSIEHQASSPDFWNDQEAAQKLLQKRSLLDYRDNMDEVFEEQQEVAKDPFSDVHEKELREKLLSAINDLTPEHKAVIVLRTLEGLSYKDIGDILGCSEGTVMSRLHYARKKLQEKLRAYL